MAYAQPSPALPSPSLPMAKTGYGKRPAGDEDPYADPDFAHLSPRDREIAVFVDHLHEGHAMGYKAIAAEHPRYGQQEDQAAGVVVGEVAGRPPGHHAGRAGRAVQHDAGQGYQRRRHGVTGYTNGSGARSLVAGAGRRNR